MSAFQSPSPSGGKMRPLSPFVSKLKLLLSDPKYEDAIRWSVSGEAIVIFDAETFKRIILDKTAEMFKTKNFTSFVRQLNLYGFRKVPVNGKSDPNKNMKFEHPHFVQRKPQLMHLVQRTCSSSKKRKPSNDSVEFHGSRKSMAENRSLKTTVRGGGVKGESHAREKAAWLNEYYSMATKVKVESDSNMAEEDESSSSRESELEEDESFALEYMYRKFREEQNAVQLLMYLKYSQPNPEVFPTNGGVWDPQYFQTNYLIPNSSATTTTTQELSKANQFCQCFACQESFVKPERAD